MSIHAQLRWKFLAVLAVRVLTAVVLGGAVNRVEAADILMDFEGYANGGPLSALHYPGVHFSTPDIWNTSFIIRGLNHLSGGVLLTDSGAPLTIQFDEPKSQVSFAWERTEDVNNTNVPHLMILQGFLKGEEVYHETLSTYNSSAPCAPICYEGSAHIGTQVDRLILSVPDQPVEFIIDNLLALGEADLFLPGDERINHDGKDRAAPVAIYCEPHGIQVRKIDPDTAEGIDPPAINLFFADIEKAGVPTEENLLLAENDGVSLYRLTTGEFQVNVLYPREYKWYIFAWDACPPSKTYHLSV